MKHNEAHPLADKQVQLNDTAKDPLRSVIEPGAVFRVENWVDQIDPFVTWQGAITYGNWAAKHYRDRVQLLGLPDDDEVVYGKIGPFGHIVHVSELGEVVA